MQMILRPAHLQELAANLRAAHASDQRIGGVELQGFDAVIEYTPEDMTATVQAGITLPALQEHLRRHGQWLPLDPPNPDRLTIRELIAANLSGPRRYGHGTVRDHLIGITVVLADGRIVKSGGKVVKNVAGYDLAKLFVGGRDSLGITAEATFKVKPLPEIERFVEKRLASIDEARTTLDALWNSDLTPVVLDLHDVAAEGTSCLVVGFAGAREDVDYQLQSARELGISTPGSLDHERDFWAAESPLPVRCASVLPSEVTQFVRSLTDVPWIARAGNGLICYRGDRPSPQQELPTELLKRVKDTFDPKHILPDTVFG